MTRSSGDASDDLKLTFPTLACGAALAFTIFMLLLLAGNTFWVVQRESRYIADNLELQALRGTLLYYDEGLTMSVSMATVDGSPKWEQRFYEFEDKLRRAISRSIEMAPTSIALQTMGDLELINQKLLQMERRCFESIRQGDSESARKILEGGAYQEAKAQFSHQVKRLANELMVQMQRNESRQSRSLISAVAIVFIIVLMIVVVWWVVVHHLRRWRDQVLQQYASRSRAENALRYHAENLEKTVAARTAEIHQSMKATEAFSYSLAHDLRAPARAMGGFAQALIQDCGPSLSDTAREYTQRILSAAIKMDRLISDLLNYTRVGQKEVPLQPLDLNRLLEQMIADLQWEIEARKANIEVAGPLPAITGDATLVTLVFSNLIENAIKYVPSGVQPKVRIWADVAEATVKISVKDNGVGIAPHYQQRIFGIFERLPTEHTYSGTGIGLAIVSRAVEKMHGRVGVVSEENKGSTFWVELPKAKAPANV